MIQPASRERTPPKDVSEPRSGEGALAEAWVISVARNGVSTDYRATGDSPPAALRELTARLSSPPGPDPAPTRDDVEWLVWYARKQKGTIAEVAQRALDENPVLRPGGWHPSPSPDLREAAQAVMDVADLYVDDNEQPLWDDIPVELADKLDILRAALDKIDTPRDDLPAIPGEGPLCGCGNRGKHVPNVDCNP